MEDSLAVDLHTLSATPVVVCRQLVLQQALESIGLSMHESTTRDDESHEILTAVHIDVPAHIHMPRLQETLFYGDWSLSAETTLQSACFAALAYLQKVNIVSIDGIHSAELKHCQRRLLEASFWSEAFEDHAAKLQSKLTAVTGEAGGTSTKKPADIKLLPLFDKPNTNVVPQDVVKEETPDVSLFLGTPSKLRGESSSRHVQNAHSHIRRALFVQLQDTKLFQPLHTIDLPFRPRCRNRSLPVATPGNAAANRNKRKLALESSRGRVARAMSSFINAREEGGQAGQLPVTSSTSNTYVAPETPIEPLPLTRNKKYTGEPVKATPGSVGKENNH